MAPLPGGSPSVPKVQGRPRHVPQRTCVACRQTDAKRQLVRVVRTSDGHALIDPTGKHAGRGAYVCSSSECWHSALRKNLLQRALKVEALPEEDLRTLNQYAERLSSSAESTSAHQS
ncbi:MAG: YlxR family protein [Chloroflexi bacterium]|nr:YlxR family protein [Chloroflexota bacterium]